MLLAPGRNRAAPEPSVHNMYVKGNRNNFFATQILGSNVISRNQGLSSNDQGRQRRETPGTRLIIKKHGYEA